MKLLYVWMKAPPPAMHAMHRLPKESYVEAALQAQGVEVRRSYWQEPTLLSTLGDFSPDIVLFSHPPTNVDAGWMSTIREKVPNAVLALICFDYTQFRDDPSRAGRFLSAAKHMDAFCSKEEGLREYWESKGVHFFRAVQGYITGDSTKYIHPSKSEKDDRPIIFTGCHTTRRDELLAGVQNTYGSRLHVYSQTRRWQLVKNVRPPVFGKELFDVLCRASVVLDFSNGDRVAGYYSDRVVNTLAAGMPMVAEWAPGMDNDFVHGVHLFYWKETADIYKYVNAITNSAQTRRDLSVSGTFRANEYFSYVDTVDDILNACRLSKERKNEGLVSVYTKELKRKEVLVYGQWRPQGLGYIARRIVDFVEGSGGKVRVASINDNPEWDVKHRFDKRSAPPDSTQAIFFLEKADDAWLDWAKKRNVLTVYMPMWEFFRPKPEFEWAMKADVVTAVPYREMAAALGRDVRELLWSTELRPMRPLEKGPGEPVVFYHDARGIEQGKYDMRPRHHPQAVLQAFRALREKRQDFEVIFRTKNNPITVSESWIRCVDGEKTREELFALIRQADVAVATCGPEGLGLPYYEYQAMGVVPLALDVPPVNVAVTSGDDGVLIQAESNGSKSLAMEWYPVVSRLVAGMLHLLNREELSMFKQGCHTVSCTRSNRFEKFLASLLNR